MEQITNLLAITLGAVLANNFIFSQFLGICPLSPPTAPFWAWCC